MLRRLTLLRKTGASRVKTLILKTNQKAVPNCGLHKESEGKLMPPSNLIHKAHCSKTSLNEIQVQPCCETPFPQATGAKL